MKIDSQGNYDYCRWGERGSVHNIRDMSPNIFFQKYMQTVRQEFMQGAMPARCAPCRVMDQHNKISGRQRQLLKIGVKLQQFEKTLASSPWAPILANQDFSQMPQDWQIDLGNYCNSACIFCSPQSSSRLAAEWKKIGFIDQLPDANWSNDAELVKKFVDCLKQSKHIQYIHFIGGETMIMPSFKKILQELIDAGLNQTATIGFTTNLTVWDESLIPILEKFQSINLGMSIESFDSINEYVRWPITQTTMFENLQKWVDISNKLSWLKQIRITPSCLTIHKILPIYDYALANNVSVESCNFLFRPEILMPSVIPREYRNRIVKEMQQWVDRHNDHSDVLINTRDPGRVQAQLVQDLSSYINYLVDQPDHSNRLPELMSWLKKIESSRGNSVLTYLPEYEELFKSAGY